MSAVSHSLLLACIASGPGWAARCTTVADARVLREYDAYVAKAEQAMPARFASGELAWVPGYASGEAAAGLADGKLVRWNISDTAVNQRLAAQNGTIIHWIGAIRIPGASLEDVRSVLEDYDSYRRIYRPIVFECQAERYGPGPRGVYDVTLGLHNTYRFASLFPQHYAFRVTARMDYAPDPRAPEEPELHIRLRASEIRESDSGVPGRTDLLEPYHDHGIMWALNVYWRARRRATGLYLEFETITLARSVQAFACKIGFVPVPKTMLSAAMDSMPADSVKVILEGTRAECRRRALQPPDASQASGRR